MKIVLIIDDNEDMQEIWRLTLGKMKNRVMLVQATTFADAQIYIGELEDSPDAFDAIVFDGCLTPGGKLLDTLPLVQQARGNPKFMGWMIATSNRPDFNDKLMAAGCQYIAQKDQVLPVLLRLLGLS